MEFVGVLTGAKFHRVVGMNSVATQRDSSPLPGEELNLWAQHQADQNLDSRNALVTYYQKWASAVAVSVVRERGFPADVDLSDVRQQAVEELVSAVDRFDPARGVNFKAYVKKRIRGSVQDFISASSEVHAQSEWRRQSERDRLTSLKQDSSRRQSLIDELSTIAVGVAVGLMLEGTRMYSSGSESAQRNPYSEGAELNALRDRLRVALSVLGEPDKSVLVKHYLHEISFADIAGSLNLSRARVSQVHARAIRALRQKLGDQPIDKLF